jgi:hypothetical protein
MGQRGWKTQPEGFAVGGGGPGVAAFEDGDGPGGFEALVEIGRAHV